MKREDVQKFVNELLEEKDCVDGFEYLDSLQKLEVVMDCEKEYSIGITEDDVSNDCDTDHFVEMVYTKIIAR